jgi:hypothetical protein
MEGVLFRYTDPVSGAVQVMHLPFNPNSVNWSYNMNTNEINTYGGQVIQILSVNIDRLTIEGSLGSAGPWGRKVLRGEGTDRWGAEFPDGSEVQKTIDEQFTDTDGMHGVGLTQMVHFFRTYFAYNTQGGTADQPELSYQQIEMTLSYLDRIWTVIPVEFPSFKRSNLNFAPEWQVVCEVVQPDSQAIIDQKQDLLAQLESALGRLPSGIGWKAANPFSDPLVQRANADTEVQRIVTAFHAMLPSFSKGEIQNMLWENVSMPIVEGTFDTTTTETTELEGLLAKDDFNHGGSRG